MSAQLTFSSFAIAGGTGTLGTYIARALIEHGAQVVILSRDGARPTMLDGAQYRVVDYDDEKTLVSALRDVEVVVSALAASAVSVQPPLATAAKKAGVKLFVPA